MAVIGTNELKPFLEAWGIDFKNVTSIIITMIPDDVVRVSIDYLFNPDDLDKLNETMSKEYAIVELKNE